MSTASPPRPSSGSSSSSGGTTTNTAAVKLRQRIREPVDLKHRVALGKGTFGDVYQALDSETGALIAIKKMAIDTQRVNREHIDRIVNEISLMKKLTHKNIIEYIGAARMEDNVLWIAMECAVGGSLARLIERYGPLPEQLVRKYTRHAVAGLQYLHSCKSAHRDIKCENLLLCDNGVVKLADFGCAKQISEAGGLTNTVVGTPLFMAPEVANVERHTKYDPYAADIWTMGITVIQMLKGAPPFTQMSWMMQCQNPDAVVELPKGVSAECTEFLQRCLRRNPSERATANELAGMLFVNDNSSSQQGAAGGSSAVAAALAAARMGR